MKVKWLLVVFSVLAVYSPVVSAQSVPCNLANACSPPLGGTRQTTPLTPGYLEPSGTVNPQPLDKPVPAAPFIATDNSHIVIPHRVTDSDFPTRRRERAGPDVNVRHRPAILHAPAQ